MTRPSGPSRPPTALTLARLAGVLFVVAVLATGLALPVVGGIGLVASHEANKFLDSSCDLVESSPPQGTTLLANDGKTVLATIFTQNRKPVPLTSIPVKVQKALIDTEDRRFYQHHGVDMRSLIRSAFSTSGGDTQGGSTLDMQYVKQVRYYQAIGNSAAQEAAISQNLNRKIQDAKCAIDLEKRESKDQILDNYFNIAFFGENAYSIESAAETYFDESAAQLTVPQGALLVGLLRAPSAYDPFQHPEASKERRNEVLQNMVTAGDLTQAAATAYAQTPVSLATTSPPQVNEGCFNAPGTVSNVGFFCDYVLTWLEQHEHLTQSQIATGGYRVVTTLSPSIQDSAQAGIAKAVKANLPSTAILPVIDPRTGNVLAMASSKQFGLSNDGSHSASAIFTNYIAPAASTYKYFTMITALEAGWQPNSKLSNNANDNKSYLPEYCGSSSGAVTNADQNIKYTSTETLQTAIAQSSNTYFVALEDGLLGCNLQPILDTASSLGVQGLNQVDPSSPSKQTYAQEIIRGAQWGLTLGYYPTSPLELTGAYAAAANDGVFCTPAPVLSITNVDGAPVTVNRTPCSQQMTPQVARTAMQLLGGDTAPGGTSAKVFQSWYQGKGSVVAGKTGTDTNNGLNTSFWFVGATPNLVATLALVNVDNPEATATDIPGYPNAYAAKDLDGSVAAKFWLDALGPTLMGQKWTLRDPNGLPGAITVPNVVGQSLADATTMLQAADFKVQQFSVPCGSTALYGQVAYYSPHSAAPGTTITICTTQGNPPYVFTPPPKPSLTPSGSATATGHRTNPPGSPSTSQTVGPPTPSITPTIPVITPPGFPGGGGPP